MDETSRDTEGMQGDGVRDDAARVADDRAKAGDATSRTSADAMGGAGHAREEGEPPDDARRREPGAV